MQLISNECPVAHDLTIEETYTKRMEINGSSTLISVTDTAGHSDFLAMLEKPMKTHDGFILVYDVTKPSSFDYISELAEKIKEARNAEVLPQCVLVANKTDHEKSRKITKSSGQALADELKLKYLEVSAKKGLNCKEAFESLVKSLAEERESGVIKGASSVDGLAVRAARERGSSMQKLQDGNCCDGLSTMFTCEREKEETKFSVNLQKLEREKIPPDVFPLPVLSLKNFSIEREFSFWNFFSTFICLPLFPFMITYQTLGMVTANQSWFPGEWQVNYAKVHSWAFYDILGLLVGRDATFDPEGRKDRKYFVLQSRNQIIVRILICLLVWLLSVILVFNAGHTFHGTDKFSKMESVGPTVLFLAAWSLFSAWIGYEFRISDDLPPLRRLRGVDLYFSDTYQYKTTVYTFLRSYWRSKDAPYSLSLVEWVMCVSVGLLYALIPGICRVAFENTIFFTKKDPLLTIGAMIINFTFVSAFIYGMFRQFSGKFQQYKEWMSELTYLLAKASNEEVQETWESVSMRGTRRSKARTITDIEVHGSLADLFEKKPELDVLFLSFRRRSNIVGWLDLRAYLGMEGSLLFGQQELPTLWLVIGSVMLMLFLVFRVFFVDSADNNDAYRSTLWNGIASLALVCCVSLVVIAQSSRRFRELQLTQERLIAEQKFYLKCDASVDDFGTLQKRMTSVKPSELREFQFGGMAAADLEDDALERDAGTSLASGASVAFEEDQKGDEAEPLVATAVADSDDDGDSSGADLDFSLDLPSSEDELYAQQTEKGQKAGSGEKDDEKSLDKAETTVLLKRGKSKMLRKKKAHVANDRYSLDFVNTAADIVNKKPILPTVFGFLVDDLLVRTVLFMTVVAFLCVLGLFLRGGSNKE
jgi:small GTP-binding protein